MSTVFRRFVPAAAVVVALLFGAAPLAAQKVDNKKLQDKLDKAQREETSAIVKLVDGVVAGQPAPADFTISFENHFLKAMAGQAYVPFTLSVDPKQLPPTSVVMYVRVVKAGGAAAAPAPAAAADKKDKKDDKDMRTQHPFEDIYFFDLKKPEGDQPYKIRRPFQAPAGDYELYVAIKERTPEKKDKNTPAGKTSVLKQAVSVPDYWNNDLTTSSIIIAEKVDPLQRPPGPDEMREHPYAFGNVEITPSAATKFSKKQELSVMFFVYNPALDAQGKPDITIDYSFYTKAAEGEKYFNKTDSTKINAQTMPSFDAAAGHQLTGGQTVPLATFPEGDYRLEIKITDKTGSKTVTRNVNFTVAGA